MFRRNQLLCTDVDGGCLLRDPGVDSEFLATLLVRLMAGEDVSALMRGRPRLTPRAQCVACTQRVMRGQAPLPTAEEWTEAVRQGHRFLRRRRHRDMAASRMALDRRSR